MILKNINPTSQVRISNLKDAIEQETLQKIINNAVVMLDRIYKHLEDIKNRASMHNDYLRQMFRALMTSTILTFIDFIQREKEKWET